MRTSSPDKTSHMLIIPFLDKGTASNIVLWFDYISVQIVLQMILNYSNIIEYNIIERSLKGAKVCTYRLREFYPVEPKAFPTALI